MFWEIWVERLVYICTFIDCRNTFKNIQKFQIIDIDIQFHLEKDLKFNKMIWEKISKV